MITCSVITSVLGCIVTSYLFFRYTWCADLGSAQRAAVFGLFLLAGCVPLLVSYGFEKIWGRFYSFYRYTLYYIFVGCILLFTLTLVFDALFFALSYTPLAVSFSFCLWMNYAYILLAALLAAYALYAGLRVPAVKEVLIRSEKLRCPLRLVLLSDLHLHRAVSTAKIRAIVEKTNSLKPDIILLGGDVIDDDVSCISGLLEILGKLKAKNGVYFVTGNHEFYVGYSEAVGALQKLGFRFLENEGAAVGGIYLAGIPDFFSGKDYANLPDVEKAFAKAAPEKFRLLMSHTPADFGKDNRFDLEVAGHTHGGQIFPFHLLSKLQGRCLAGLYKAENGAEIYVTRGAGQWGPQMRFLAPSEITLINLMPMMGKKKENHEV